MEMKEEKVETQEDKELVATRRKNHRDNIKREYENAKKQLVELDKRIDLFNRMSDNQVKIEKKVIEGFEFLNPNWAYEKDPEYVELLKNHNLLVQEERAFQRESQKHNLDRNKEAVQKQIENYEEEIERLEKELKEDE